MLSLLKFNKKGTAYNKGLSALSAAEHILINISLLSFSPNRTNITELWNLPAGRQVYHQLFIFDQQQYRAEVTRNISTAESPGRWQQWLEKVKAFLAIIDSIHFHFTTQTEMFDRFLNKKCHMLPTRGFAPGPAGSVAFERNLRPHCLVSYNL